MSWRKSSRKSTRRTSRKVLPPLKKGELGDYSTKKPATTRRRSLRRSVRKEGYAGVVRRLNVIRTYNKRTNPDVAAKISADMKYLKKEYRS